MAFNVCSAEVNLDQLARITTFIVAVDEKLTITWASKSVLKRLSNALNLKFTDIFEPIEPRGAVTPSSIVQNMGVKYKILLNNGGFSVPLVGEWILSRGGFILLANPDIIKREDLDKFSFDDFPEDDLALDLLIAHERHITLLNKAKAAAKALRDKNKVIEKSSKKLEWVNMELEKEITERKQAEELLENRVRQQAEVAKFGQIALSDISLDELLQEAVSLVSQVLGTKYAGVLEHWPEQKVLFLRAGIGWKKSLVGQSIPDGAASQGGYTLQQEKPVITEDIHNETRFSFPTFLNDYNVVSGMTVAIPGGEKPFGVLGVHTDKTQRFSSDDAHFLEAIANLLAAAIRRKQTEDELQYEKNRLHSIVDAMDGMDSMLTIQDSDYNIIYQNSIMERTFGGFGDKCYKIYEKKEKVCDGCPVEKAFRDGQSHTSEREVVIPEERETKHVETTAHPVRNAAGEVTSCIEVVRDITERRWAEKARESLINRQGQLNRLQQDLLGPGDLKDKLKKVTDGIVKIFDADFCRIWITRSGDICESGCIYAHITEGSDVCRDREKCLHLMASSGHYTHIDGRHMRVPFGCCKIGRIAADNESRFLTNEAATDPRILDHDWVRELGLVSFAGYKLRLPNGKSTGVLALFSKYPITQEDDILLEILSNTTSQVVQRARAEEQILQLATITEQTVEGIAVADLEGKIQFSNHAWAQMHGYENSDELVGRYLSIFHNEQQLQSDVVPFNEEARQQGHNVGEIGHMRKDGTTFPTMMTVTMLKDEQGKPYAMAGFAQDITERKKAEEELKQAKVEAEIASAAKSQFLANMSHEIRTPMNGVIGMIDLALDEPLNDKVRDYLNTARSSGNNLVEIINDILDISRIESGKVNVDIQDCSLNDLLCNINSLMRPMIVEKGVEFKNVFDSPVPERICTDPMRLRQCLTNLIGNAAKFTEVGHIFLRISTQNGEKGTEIHFDVEDTGIGIASNKQEAIFEAFNQADYSTNRKFGGTGLGLTITKKLAELLGGSISLTSELGQGSIFSLVIPVGVDVEPQSLITELNRRTFGNEISEIDDIKLSGKILVAEDDVVNQKVILSMLEKVGLQTTLANDGREVIEKTTAESFDLILMDMHMPNMNGYEATRLLREKGFKKPILALTASVMRSDVDQCLKAGCDEHLIKPIDRQKLFAALRKYLSTDEDTSGDKIDDFKTKVDELNELISGSESQEELVQDISENLDYENVIDWQDLVIRIDNEELIKKVVEEWLVHNPNRMEALAEAIRLEDAEQVRSLSHTLKGSAAAIGAIPLSNAAFELEIASKQNDCEAFESLFKKIKTGYEKLRTFVTQDNWVDTAKKSSHTGQRESK
jgi:PAS domain S-box-containing protein